ncbi:MAG: replication factor C large subunit [Candidatus Aenigmatarchaeota archaeon]
MLWVFKYRPKSLNEFVNQKEAIQKFIQWYKNWKNIKKAALLFGPPGTGKSCFVEAFARENNLELIQLNASDKRDYNSIRNIIGNATKTLSISKKGKMFFIDEVDGISAREDTGAVKEIIRIIQESKFPIVLAANDPFDSKLKELRENCELIEFKRLSIFDIEKKLIEILEKEGIKYDRSIVREIASRNNGDLRGAINDLEIVARNKKEIKREDLEILGFRDREQQIFEALKILFKTKSAMAAKLSIVNLDMEPDEIFYWIEENIANEYEKIEEIANAYECLSKADLFRKRILSRQNWRYLVYMNDLMTIGVALSKKEMYRKFTKYRPPSILKLLAQTKQIREQEKINLKEFAEKLHCSTKKIKTEFMPYLSKIFEGKK